MNGKSLTQVLFILSPSIVLVALGMDIIIPCIPAISSDLSSNFALTQWVLSAYFIGTGIGQLVVGPFADHFGRRKTILISITLFILSSLVCVSAQQIYYLIFARLLQGMGACGATVVVLAIVRDLYDGHTVPKAYSYVNGVTTLAPIFTPIIGGFLLVCTDSWRSCFYFASGFGFFALIINYFFLQESLAEKYVIENSSPRRIMHNYIEVVKDKSFICFNICAITGLTGILLFFSISPIIMINNLNINPEVYGLYFAINFIVYLIGNLCSPIIEKHTHVNKIILLGSGIILLGALLMLFWHVNYMLSLGIFLLPALIISFGIGIIYGPCMAGALEHFKHLAGTASAAYGALLYLVSGLLVAIVMQYTIHIMFLYAFVMIIMSALNMLLILMLEIRGNS